MKHNIYLSLLASAAMVVLSGCEKEAAFSMKPGEGQLKSESLAVDYINSGKKTRADVQVGDFVVNFVNTATNEVARSFKYSEMPEIVALPAGDYRAEAEYGDNAVAEWENPYYTGNTTFSIEVGKVTEDVDAIDCTLSNIKITVNVNDKGLDILEDDVKVIVSAGAEGELVYDASTNDKAGYFRYVAGSKTITAEFVGTVDGVHVDQTVAYYDADEGNSYNLNFEINRPDNMDPGSILLTESGITLDATITIKDETKIIDPNEPEDTILKDDLRPIDGSGSGDNNDPGNTPSNGGPLIESMVDEMELGKPYLIVDAESTPVKFSVSSETGITEFRIKIVSSTLTKDELESVDLSDELDLINPGEYEEKLNNLGFPTGTDVMGKTKLEFDISQFVPLLNLLGSGDHQFVLTVSDDKGTSTATVYLKN